jgi:hypothetical protein
MLLLDEVHRHIGHHRDPNSTFDSLILWHYAVQCIYRRITIANDYIARIRIFGDRPTHRASPSIEIQVLVVGISLL